MPSSRSFNKKKTYKVLDGTRIRCLYFFFFNYIYNIYINSNKFYAKKFFTLLKARDKEQIGVNIPATRRKKRPARLQEMSLTQTKRQIKKKQMLNCWKIVIGWDQFLRLGGLFLFLFRFLFVGFIAFSSSIRIDFIIIIFFFFHFFHLSNQVAMSHQKSIYNDTK